ncbi:MAG: signal recognition particle-docking protein FtsY [Lachnospiraceae bacterium]|nr:signal recognition particle-docking protein FtsY [Lachnospiraceae bacterium]
MAEENKGFFEKVFDGLAKTRDNLSRSVDALFMSFTNIDDDFYDELEETLIMADVGVDATLKIIDDLRHRVRVQGIKEPADCKELLVQVIKDQMELDEDAFAFEQEKTVMLVIGVNGVGKTTSIGKLAATQKARGKNVLVAAADTFRAAAIDQLEVWTDLAKVDLIKHEEGSDPAAVVFDACRAAKARNTDILICDTAGRLHNKKNLMSELAKINRVIEREYPEARRETLIVLDATTGQNAMAQAKTFMEAADITGIILTKMDGTAKGGIAIAIQAELGLPVKYIGLGEHINDLLEFDTDIFVSILFSE